MASTATLNLLSSIARDLGQTVTAPSAMSSTLNVYVDTEYVFLEGFE